MDTFGDFAIKELVTLKAELAHYKALCEELRYALQSISSGLNDHIVAGKVKCDSCEAEIKNAQTILAKAKEL